MKKRKDKLKIIILLVFIVSLPLIPISNTNSINPPIAFYLSVLCPNTQDYNWVTIMVEQLPKIGIGVKVFDQTSWDQISKRTWGYPSPYPIPTYSEGGFDIVCLDWNWGLDVDMRGLFDTPSFPPNGDNIYQYSRPEMDWAIGNYSQSFVLADRNYWALEIQALLYEDVPQATVKYPEDVFPHNPNFNSSSWSSSLWAYASQDMATWDIPGQTEFHYAVPMTFYDFHPIYTETVIDKLWLSQIFGGMVERTPKAPYLNAFGPYLATSFTSSNGITYQVQLDPNAKFADGTKCNANDVKNSYLLLTKSDFRPKDYGCFCEIFDENTIEIISEFEVQVNFLQSYTFQDTNLGISILPQHIWDSIVSGDHVYQAGAWALNDTLDSNLFGIGPYFLYDCSSNNETIHLKANPYWDTWGGHTTQKFTDIYFHYYSNKMSALADLESGVIDMIDSGFDVQLDDIPETVSYTKVTGLGTTEMAFNTLHPYIGTGELTPLGTKDAGKYIRKAISHIIPRDILIDNVFVGLGEPGVTAFPKGAIGFDDSLEPYEYNIQLAREYMKLSGSIIDCPQSSSFGIGFKTILGILAFIGGSVQLSFGIRNRKKRI